MTDGSATRTLFFALWPDMRQRDRLRDFIGPSANSIDGKAVDRRQWHITLAYVGEIQERYIAELQESAKAVTFEPFRLRLDRIEYWARPKIGAAVPPTVPAELEQLVEDLKGLVFAAGIEPALRTYRPHITVVRNARPFEPVRLSHSAMNEWSSFELMESISERGETIYRPIVKDF